MGLQPKLLSAISEKSADYFEGRSRMRLEGEAENLLGLFLTGFLSNLRLEAPIGALAKFG